MSEESPGMTPNIGTKLKIYIMTGYGDNILLGSAA